MTTPDLAAWAVPRLSQLLPLDEGSLTQIVTYSTSLSKQASAEHLKNLLGDSPAALEFISSFNSRRETDGTSSADTRPSSRSSENEGRNSRERPSGAGAGGKKGKKTARAPLHSTGPPRRPENYGNTAGGYKKSDVDEDYMSLTRKSLERSTARDSESAQSRPSETAATQVPSLTASPYVSSAGSSRNQSPAPKATVHANSTPKPPPSASGPLISDFLPNVRSKAARTRHGGVVAGPSGGNSGTSTPSKRSASPATTTATTTSLTTNNIADLTAAIAALEVSTNPKLSGQAAGSRQKCNCYATLHPLFEPAPNCLNCGKIICALEGLQPCSFCGTPLLSSEEVQSMIRELRAERGQEKMRAHNESVTHRDHMGPGPGSGLDSGSSPSKLDAARAHRDKLLAFQAQNARRTRVVDEAADFETPNVASTLWMTPAQRALALKKQQRVQREMEEKARPEWEKKKTVLSLDIKGGRVTRVYQTAGGGSDGGDEANAAESQAEEELAQMTAAAEQSSTARRGGEAFSRNPLLAAGGLLRPIWKAPSGKEPAASTARVEHKQTWRRVQDDNDDNEQWILDGGTHGYST